MKDKSGGCKTKTVAGIQAQPMSFKRGQKMHLRCLCIYVYKHAQRNLSLGKDNIKSVIEQIIDAPKKKSTSDTKPLS